MQNALRTIQIPLFGCTEEGPDSLNALTPVQPAHQVLSLKHNRSAPAPLNHEHIRPHIQLFAQDTNTTPLLHADIATILPKRARSARALWHMMTRMAAGALDPFSIQITPTTNGTQNVVDVVASIPDDSLEDDFFHARLPRADLAEGMIAFVNEILETGDAFGRIYTLELNTGLDAGPNTPTTGQVIAYLTEGEVDVLEAEGIYAELI